MFGDGRDRFLRIRAVELSIAIQQKLGAGVFGGEGFILQKVSGSGQAWVELDGEVILYDLQPGEVLRVHPGHIGMFEATVGFNITTVPGIKNKLFGGDGIFLATLTGPSILLACAELGTPPSARLATAPVGGSAG